jgi:hypothetical protein
LSVNQEQEACMGLSHKALKLLTKNFCGRTAALCVSGLLATALSGCIRSNAPILTDAKPILGEQGQIHSYVLHDGGAHDPVVLNFRWNGSRYLLRGRSEGIHDFTAYPYEGRDLIVQSTSVRLPHRTEYGLARRLAEGVYLMMAIDETDADEATREKFCTKTRDTACGVTTPEQLFVFARATAAKLPDRAGLAVIVPTRAR